MTSPAQHAPRTMSAEQERVIREHNVSLTGTPRDLRDVLVELEQERIMHAATLAALEKIADADGMYDEWKAQGIARAAIARAKGGQP